LEDRPRGKPSQRAPSRILVVIATAALVLGSAAAIAAAQDTTTTTPGSQTTSQAGSSATPSAPAPAQGTQRTGRAEAEAAPKSGRGSLTLKSEDFAPNRVFYFGKRAATYRYSIAGNRPRSLKIQAVRRKNWRVVRTWKRRVQPDKVHRIKWSGSNRQGRPVSKGTYVFRVQSRRGRPADRSRTKRRGDRSARLFPYKFPIRARHTYGDGYGAPRSGHRHQGQDLMASCGEKVAAARGGRVQYRRYQGSGAGYYMVIDGKGTGHDYVYMHLRRRGRPGEGKRVQTGQRIGFVGRSGSSSACHLHFEMWTRPGWYEGGDPMRAVTRHLRQWDRWS
jgi:murein DD-endopeptidase MepM/ murein hydrolase activator NlpD